jgi:hypothetical protein
MLRLYPDGDRRAPETRARQPRTVSAVGERDVDCEVKLRAGNLVIKP